MNLLSILITALSVTAGLVIVIRTLHRYPLEFRYRADILHTPPDQTQGLMWVAEQKERMKKKEVPE